MKWTIWRPCLAGLDTLTNIKYNWDIDDLMDAHEALDIREEAEREQIERSKRSSK